MGHFLSATFFSGLFVIYYLFDIPVVESHELFLTILTFLFSIFAGFAIQRQAERYSSIREKLAEYDGEMSYLFRAFGHFGKRIQKKIEKHIRKDYQIMAEDYDWDLIFVEKSQSISTFHNVLEELATKKKDLNDVQESLTESITGSLNNLQQI